MAISIFRCCTVHHMNDPLYNAWAHNVIIVEPKLRDKGLSCYFYSFFFFFLGIGVGNVWSCSFGDKGKRHPSL